MYKVMIVDDEPILRKGLINFIDWNSLDCEIVYEAVDGIDAKEQLVSLHPDIIITDIKMPGMNGIELSKHIYDNLPGSKIIVLTGYADFEYARAAIKYGVVDFVLKPTATDKILEAVQKAKELLLKERQKVSLIKDLEEKVIENTAEMQEKLVHELFDGIIEDDGKLFEKMSKLNIKLDKIYVLVFEIYPNNSNPEDNSTVNEKRNISTLKNVISLAFKEVDHYSVLIKSNVICTLLSFSEGNHSECMQQILTNCNEIIELSEGFMNYNTSVGISHEHKSPVEISQAYLEAANALSNMFYDDTESTIHMPYLPAKKHFDSSFTKKYIDTIIAHIQQGNGSLAVKVLNEMFAELKANHTSTDDIKDLGILLCSLISRLLNNHSMNINNLLEHDTSLYQCILESKSITVLLGMLTQAIMSTTSYLSSNERQVHYIIKNVKQYLNEHFKENISLSSIADHVHVNSSYLSRLFKREVGENITETLTTIRMEKAKEMLLYTDLKTYEIASMVGIDDPAYFSLLFKRYTSCSPTEYRQSRI